MTQRNIIRFAGTASLLELVAQGTMWPTEIVVDGETWKMGEVVDAGAGFATREYVHTGRVPRGRQRSKTMSAGS